MTIKLAKDTTTDVTVVATVEEIVEDYEINELANQVFAITEEISTEEPIKKKTSDRPNSKRLKIPQIETERIKKPRNPKTLQKDINILSLDDKVDKNDVVYILYLEEMGRDE